MTESDRIYKCVTSKRCYCGMEVLSFIPRPERGRRKGPGFHCLCMHLYNPGGIPVNMASGMCYDRSRLCSLLCPPVARHSSLASQPLFLQGGTRGGGGKKSGDLSQHFVSQQNAINCNKWKSHMIAIQLLPTTFKCATAKRVGGGSRSSGK